MPETMTLNSTAVTGNNDTFTDLISVSGASIERATPTVPAAKVGTLTTRTDNDTGTLTMISGHGFTDGQKVDVFWSGGYRRNMTIGTVATNSVPIDGGSGDNLPAAATAITAMIPTEVPFVVTGNSVLAVGVSSPAPGCVVFCDGSGDIAAATYRIATPGYGKTWANGNGVTNPLASATTTKIKFSHSDSTASREMKAAVIHN